jgi:RNA polymerase sigma-70 factor (ECF subfamily)
MRAHWEALHESLAHAVRTLEAAKKFTGSRRKKRALARFADAISLLEYLNSKSGDLDEKDAIYAALIELVQGRGEEADVAMALAWLGLWPALDAIFRRRLRHFRDVPEELVSEIASCFTSQMQRADLSRIARVAATLTRNTERDVREGRRAAWDEAARRADLPEDHELADPAPPPELSELGLPSDLTPEEEVAAIRALLVPIVGDDADLVIGAAIYGDSQHELADQLGITHEAARKRFQRALGRLRARFQGLR